MITGAAKYARPIVARIHRHTLTNGIVRVLDNTLEISGQEARNLMSLDLHVTFAPLTTSNMF